MGTYIYATENNYISSEWQEKKKVGTKTLKFKKKNK